MTQQEPNDVHRFFILRSCTNPYIALYKPHKKPFIAHTYCKPIITGMITVKNPKDDRGISEGSALQDSIQRLKDEMDSPNSEFGIAIVVYQ